MACALNLERNFEKESPPFGVIVDGSLVVQRTLNRGTLNLSPEPCTLHPAR